MAANVMEIYGSKVFNEHVMKEYASALRICELDGMSRLRRSVLEIVANSPLGQNMLRLGRIFFELFAQPPDMHVHRADLAADVVAPDRVEQRLA